MTRLFHQYPSLHSHEKRLNDKAEISRSTYESLMADKEHKQSVNNRQSPLFFSIGLAISLLLIVTAFEWKFYDEGSVVELSVGTQEDFQEIIDIPQTKQPPPPKQENYNLVVIPDEEVILEEIDLSIDMEITEETAVADVIYVEEFEPPEEVAEEIFTIVEEQPLPIGGLAVFYKFIGDNLNYPSIARKMEIQGKVFVQFVVEKNGAIGSIKVIKGIGGGCDEETKRVVSMAPNWNPGKQRGNPVRVRVILPIHFVLNSNS